MPKNLRVPIILYTFALAKEKRGVAQSGSAPGLGPGGRRFESCRPDTKRGSSYEEPLLCLYAWQVLCLSQLL